MELDHQDTLEVLVGVLDHQVEELELIIAGQAGLELEAQVEMVHTELQAEAAEAAELAVEDHAVVEQEAHKQLITQADRAWTEQARAAEEIITQVESVKREVLA
jgi:hypothetical protein